MVRLRKLLPRLLAPKDGKGSLVARLFRDLLVAPYAQLTFFSFDLQVFLFDVLHMKPFARVTHAVGMPLVNLGFAAALTALTGSPWGALGYGLVLALWYGRVAFAAGLPGWWAAMLPLLAGIAAGGAVWGAHASALELGALILGTGFVLACGHIPEPLPPRAGHPLRYTTGWGEVIFGSHGEPRALLHKVRKTARFLSYFPIGLANEILACPRVMPYNVLRLMTRAGYAPELAQELDARRDRAWAAGNPALDWVGVGGGAVLVDRSR